MKLLVDIAVSLADLVLVTLVLVIGSLFGLACLAAVLLWAVASAAVFAFVCVRSVCLPAAPRRPPPVGCCPPGAPAAPSRVARPGPVPSIGRRR